MRIEGVDWDQSTAFLRLSDAGGAFTVVVPRWSEVTTWVVYLPSGCYNAHIYFENKVVEVWSMPAEGRTELLAVYPEQRKKITRNLPEWF